MFLVLKNRQPQQSAHMMIFFDELGGTPVLKRGSPTFLLTFFVLTGGKVFSGDTTLA